MARTVSGSMTGSMGSVTGSGVGMDASVARTIFSPGPAACSRVAATTGVCGKAEVGERGDVTKI